MLGLKYYLCIIVYLLGISDEMPTFHDPETGSYNTSQQAMTLWRALLDIHTSRHFIASTFKLQKALKKLLT